MSSDGNRIVNGDTWDSRGDTYRLNAAWGEALRDFHRSRKSGTTTRSGSTASCLFSLVFWHRLPVADFLTGRLAGPSWGLSIMYDDPEYAPYQKSLRSRVGGRHEFCPVPAATAGAGRAHARRAEELPAGDSGTAQES